MAAAMPTLRELGIPVMVHSELVDDNLEIEEVFSAPPLPPLATSTILHGALILHHLFHAL